MRPAPLLIALIAGWGLAGLAVPFLGWPLWQWQLAGGAMLIGAELLKTDPAAALQWAVKAGGEGHDHISPIANLMRSALAEGRLVQLTPQWQAEPLPVNVGWSQAVSLKQLLGWCSVVGLELRLGERDGVEVSAPVEW